jgi:hypothetical protein
MRGHKLSQSDKRRVFCWVNLVVTSGFEPLSHGYEGLFDVNAS